MSAGFIFPHPDSRHNLRQSCADNILVNTNLQQLALRALCETFPAYRNNECHLNVRQILDQMEREPVDLSDVRALVITPAQSPYFKGLKTLWQHAQQSWYGPDWTFHVCLDVQGRVFDPDFTGVPGLKIPDYVENMFGRGARDLVARVHSAENYREFWYENDKKVRLREWEPDQMLPLNRYAAERARECRHAPSLLIGAERFAGIEQPLYRPPWWNQFVE